MAEPAGHLIQETGKPIMFVDLASKEDQLKSIQELRAISYANPERTVEPSNGCMMIKCFWKHSHK